MKIFFASQSFYPNIGGVSTYLLNLGRELQKRGNEVSEIHLRPIGAEPYEEIKGIDVYRVPKEPINNELLQGFMKFKEKVWNECHGFGGFDREVADMEGFREYNEINEAIAAQLNELLENEPAEVVDIHDFQLLYLYRGVPRGTPLLLRWHIPFLDTMSPYLKDFLIKHMIEYDRVVFSSQQYIENAVKAGLPREKTALLYPLANNTLFKKVDSNPDFRSKFNLIDKKIILSAQRIDIKSGHEQLIKAMPAILEKVPDARLVFVGGKSFSSKVTNLRAQYEKSVHDLIEQLNLQDKVIFTGTIPYESLPSVIAHADVCALTSKIEGFGLAVTEAMSCGKPVIGTNAGGIPMQIEHGRNGYLVEVNDIADTANKIIYLLQNPNVAEGMGRESLDIIEEKFTLDKNVDHHIGLYHEVLKEKSEWGPKLMKKEDVKAFITDFDRTITDEPGVVNIQVLEKLESLEIPLILVTGRNFEYAKALYEKHPLWKCIIAENGAAIYFPEVDQLITFASKALSESKKIISDNNIPSVEGLNIISVNMEHKTRVQQLLQVYEKKLDYKENVNEVMILPHGVNKGIATKIALNHLGIEAERTIIMGDAANDIDLFNVPGYRIAVANAEADLKNIADHITKKDSASGVIEVIEELMK